MKKKTKIIESGRRREWTMGAVNPAVVRASTVLFDSVADLRAAPRDQEKGFYYGRRGTPTSQAFCKAINDLENGAGTVAYPSGLAAINASILAFVKTGDSILVPDSVYDPTRTFCDEILPAYGVTATYYDPLIGADISTLIQGNTRLVFTEAPGSVTMEVQDIPAIIKAAHARDVIVLMDNTWATPLLFPALDYGVDISISAATKYISGHSDVMLGTATANEKCFPQLYHFSGVMGYCVGSDDLYLALRGLRTLSVRLQQHEKNALEIARWLAARPDIDRVLHPALPACPGHEIWKRDFKGSSGLFSFVMKDGHDKAAVAMLDGMEHFKMGFSWGGYESLILTYQNIDKMRTVTGWQAPGPLFRVHIGLEDIDDLKADLDAGLARFQAAI